MFSETRVGLYSAHTLANRPSGWVTLSATKSVTDSQSNESEPVDLQSAANLFNLMFEFQPTNLCKQFIYQ
jgi:hypothetical protein